MRDLENKILEKYWVDVNSVRRARGGFLCDTKQGLYRIKELSTSDKKTPYVQFLCEQLIEAGLDEVDVMLRNKENGFVCDMRDAGKYVLKKWYMGRECDINREREVLAACRTLAKLHNYMDDVSRQIAAMQSDLATDRRWEQFQGTHLVTEWSRHSRGLRKARSYMRSRVSKGEFEAIYLQCFEEIYDQAKLVEHRMKASGYDRLYSHAIENYQLVHGDYNYHNILFVGSQVAVTNFERFRIDVPIADLYYFLRKVMEKSDWNKSLGKKMIASYGMVREISEAELEYIALRLSYPEKVWKLTNYYYNSNKAWISQKNVEKLQKSIEQMAIKRQFVQEIFAFHL